MKNIKFGTFALGLLLVVLTAISSVSAQGEARPSTRDRRPLGDVLSLRAGGAQLGVMVSDLDAKAATSGVRIDEVNAGSPAEKAGIKAGDIVVDLDGERVRSVRQFTRLVQETPEGRSVAIGLMRDGKKQTVNATPEAGQTAWDFGPEVDRAMREAERGMRNFRFDMPRDFEFRYDGPDERRPRRFEYRMPDGVFRFPAPGSRLPGSRGRLGASVQSITPELAEYFGAKDGGALVSSVTRDSAAAKAGLKPGDVIVSINGNAVRDAGDLIDRLEDVEGDATIVVIRDKKEMTLKATLSARSGVL
ncbi:MAG TPA: PDZ domain-containing protein [Vicinamibacterales bacterium]